jgi:pimeloyl-ACP methyl ester carboxylesterase
VPAGAAPTIARAFVATARGTLHVASAGTGFPVLLLHQTPRSWDEYREVLPLLGGRYRAIAMDTPGFGDSPPFDDGEPSIERWAGAALALLDAMGIGRAAIVGHHTGAVIAMEAAVQAGGRIAALVLSSCPMVDAARRERHAGPTIDDVDRSPGGAHLLRLWQRRQPFYPEGDVALLERFMADALRAGDRGPQGHRCVNRYRMESRIGQVACPTLVLAAPEDPHAYPSTRRIAAAIRGSRRTELAGGRVPLPDQMPAAFADAVARFLDDAGLDDA